jgi:hypothetical protein
LLAVRRGQYVATGAGAGEGIIGNGRRRGALRVLAKRAAVAAIQNQHLALGATFVHQIANFAGGDAARLRPVEVRGRRRQEQAIAAAKDAVTRVVQQDLTEGASLRIIN